MEKVVYVLGAGFSAPLGLPVMNNFLVKAKNLYFQEPERYGHFERVLKEVNKLSVIKNYYDSDQFNIEEILSILEMMPSAGGSSLRKAFAKLIEDVILHFTPDLSPYSGSLPSNWKVLFWGQDDKWQAYGALTGALLGLTASEHWIQSNGDRTRSVKISTIERAFQYSVITFNYDHILELPFEFLCQRYQTDPSLGFSQAGQAAPRRSELAQLHGGVGQNNIVPPTWNKTVFRKIRPAWNTAFRLLSEANHIRFIGYSLPPSDAYARYLFKAAALESKHLKHIDVLCLDGDGSIRENYERFIAFKYRRFISADTLNYLKTHLEIYQAQMDTSSAAVNYDRLERAHEEFFSKN
jgi:hypothetical protein